MKTHNNITDLSKALLPSMLNEDTGMTRLNAYHKFNVLLKSRTCEYNIDLGLTTGHTKSRWTRLVNQYIEKGKLAIFVKLAKKLDVQQSTSLLFKTVASKRMDHQYGNCLLAICYCDKTLTLLSRTCFAGYMSYFDLALAHKIAKKIGDVSEIKFRWYVVDLQLSYLRSLQVIFLDKQLMSKLNYLVKHPKRLANEAIPWRQVAGVYKRRFLYRYKRSGMKMLEEAKYGPVKRFIKRWLILQGHIKKDYPKSLTVDSLEL